MARKDAKAFFNVDAMLVSSDTAASHARRSRLHSFRNAKMQLKYIYLYIFRILQRNFLTRKSSLDRIESVKNKMYIQLLYLLFLMSKCKWKPLQMQQ